MKKRCGTISGQFSPRLITMLEAPAWRALSLSARRVIERIEIEHGHHGGKDNERLSVTYDDFRKYGVHKHAIAAAIREAEALGFIEITEQGRAGNAKWRISNSFRLTFRPSKGMRTDGTHEWRRITTIESAEVIARSARTGTGKKTFPTPSKRTSPPPQSGGGGAISHPLKADLSYPLKAGVLSISCLHIPTNSSRRRRGRGGDGGAST